MKLIQKILTCTLTLLLILSCCTGCKEEEASDALLFGSLGEALSGTATVTKEGAVMDASSRTPTAHIALTESINLNGRGLFTLTVKNTSDAQKLTVEFITEEDSNYTNFKVFDFPLEKTEGFAELSVDVSAVYGWLGHLTGLKITAVGLNEGEIVLQSLNIKEGGEGYIKGLTFSDPYVYLTSKDRINIKQFEAGPDGILGSWRDSSGNLRFIGSASAGGVSGFFLTEGTPEDPFKTVLNSGTRVDGVDWSTLDYCSIAQVVQEPSTGMLIGITHLERHYGTLYAATLGLSTSTDNGETWTFLGEFISHDILPSEEAPAGSRDIGNGTILMDEEYLYIFINDWHESDLSLGLAVCRVKLAELYEKTLAGEMPAAYKYYEGEWNEPGWGGAFTDVRPADVVPNFLYLSYNKVLEKYIMVVCQSPYYQNNDGDILMLVSDSFLDWSNAQRQWIATGVNGEQYPTIISVEADPQLETGETFYIYWCNWNGKVEGMEPWQALWATCQYMGCKVTVTK